VKLSLHLKWYYPIMPVIFLPLNEDFFPHDFTLIASVVGKSVIGHRKGGKYVPAKMAQLAKCKIAGVSNEVHRIT
jgi:hypothetical protein